MDWCGEEGYLENGRRGSIRHYRGINEDQSIGLIGTYSIWGKYSGHRWETHVQVLCVTHVIISITLRKENNVVIELDHIPLSG